jgi:hypothetical protein
MPNTKISKEEKALDLAIEIIIEIGDTCPSCYYVECFCENEEDCDETDDQFQECWKRALLKRVEEQEV